MICNIVASKSKNTERAMLGPNVWDTKHVDILKIVFQLQGRLRNSKFSKIDVVKM